MLPSVYLSFLAYTDDSPVPLLGICPSVAEENPCQGLFDFSFDWRCLKSLGHQSVNGLGLETSEADQYYLQS